MSKGSNTYFVFIGMDTTEDGFMAKVYGLSGSTLFCAGQARSSSSSCGLVRLLTRGGTTA